MEVPIEEIKCDNHKEINFSFYCFDDNSYLCSKCFKEHKKHNIEIIDDLKEKQKVYKSLNAAKLTMAGFYLKAKNILENIKLDTQQILNNISNKIESLKNAAPPSEGKSLFSLTFKEYEHIGNIIDLLNKVREMSGKLNELLSTLKKQHEYINFRAINKEVKIIEKSQEHSEFPINIMFERDSSQEYSLFQGSKNHFLVLDLGKFFFLKDIQLSITPHDCTIKNFKVKTKNIRGIWEDAGSFVCQRYNGSQGLQVFTICKETQFVRIDFIDTWGITSGDYILIRRIFFGVADII